jgi:hypothetical protein
MDPGNYRLECLLATEGGAGTQDIFKLKVETKNNNDNRQLTVDLGNLSNYPTAYSANGYTWHKIATGTFPVHETTDIVKISCTSNAGIKTMIDDTALQSVATSAKEIKESPFRYMVNENFVFLENATPLSEARLYTADGKLLSKTIVPASGSIRIPLHAGQRLFILEAVTNEGRYPVKIIKR